MKKYVEDFRDEIDACHEDPSAYPAEYDTGRAKAAGSGGGEGDSDSDLVVGGEDTTDSDSDSTDSTDSTSGSSTDSDTDSEFDGSSTSDSDSDSDDDRKHLTGRARWVKRDVVQATRVRRRDGQGDTKAAPKVVSQADLESQMTPSQLAEHRMAVSLSKVTAKNLERKLYEILSSRGRRGADIGNHIVQLEYLAAVASKFGAEYGLPVDMHLIAARFDTIRGLDNALTTERWQACLHGLWGVLDVLDAHKDIILAPLNTDDVAEAAVQRGKGDGEEDGGDDDEEAGAAEHKAGHESDGEEDEEEAFSMSAVQQREDGKRVVRTVGLLTTIVERLSEEFTKSLQAADPHTQDYIARLKDEEWLVTTAGRVHDYFVRVGDSASAARAALVRLEHMYYRHETVGRGMHDDLAASCAEQRRAALQEVSDRITALTQRVEAVVDSAGGKKKATLPDLSPVPEQEPFKDAATADCRTEVQRLATFLYNHGDDRSRTRALLCHVFNHALHDEFYAARDLLLMSKLQDNIHKADVGTQILFNRAMACLGTCAFREGLLRDAHACLAEICGSGRAKELLAQGTTRFSDRSPEQERREKRRQTPYHMHIHAELLDACHMVAAMLLEVPNMAAAENNPRRADRQISRDYRRMMEQMLNKTFSGPPETTKDTVITAGLALNNGNWRRCRDLVLGLKVWTLWATRSWDAVAAKYDVLVREAGLKTYLVTFAPYYDSMSLRSLCSMFELESGVVHSMVSKMMINKELLASWDQPTSSIVMHKVHVSPLQHLALEFADKAKALVESNERMLATRTGQFSRDDHRGERHGRGGHLSVRRLRRRGFDPRSRDSGQGYGFFDASAARRRGRGRKGGRSKQQGAKAAGVSSSSFWAQRR